MRNVLEGLITSWMETNTEVVFLAADIGGGLYKKLLARFSDRVINVGIAEQNMIGMAAGLSDMGFRVVCYSKACFISLRVIDQIKNALCYAGKNVILIAADAGYDEADSGHPHISLEDIGAVGSLSKIDIYMPSSPYGLQRVFDAAIKSTIPSYIRFNKAMPDSINIRDIGFLLYYLLENEPKNILIITYGVSTIEALHFAAEHSGASVMAVDGLKFDEAVLLGEMRKYKKTIVMEEQFEPNGLYSCVCRMLVEHSAIGVTLERFGPEFTYRQFCFDRQTAMEIERKEYEARYGKDQGIVAAD